MTDSAFSITLRIYYEDTDAGGVVYHANYVKLLERCRTEWLRSAGFVQAELLRDTGIGFVVRHLSLDYLKPARLDDLLTVSLEVEKITRSQIFFRQHVRRELSQDGQQGEELLTGKVQIVCVNLETSTGKMKIVSIPPAMRAQLEAIQ
ncbi:tol-pal system-associated acyl-CoA thioesterase [Betaproteobacteria bacterium]|nr:tol-pal system-associated acyl-CoA thioesterase [Betaproteobacteria bacterium]